MVWNTGLCLARWGQPPPPGCAPSWSPVKINPVLAKPRTHISLTLLIAKFILNGAIANSRTDHQRLLTGPQFRSPLKILCTAYFPTPLIPKNKQRHTENTVSVVYHTLNNILNCDLSDECSLPYTSLLLFSSQIYALFVHKYLY